MINLSKGKTDQAIRRKGKKNLTERELLRRHLKSPKGKAFLQDLKAQYSKMVSDPLEYVLEDRKKGLEDNNKLKFFLLKELKYFKLQNFNPEPVKKMETPLRLNSGVGPEGLEGPEQKKGILTIRDRAVLVLVNLVMESYMEPLGDPHSFGFRIGRTAHQAVSVVANRVDIHKNLLFTQPNRRLKVEANKPLQQDLVNNTQHIINVVLSFEGVLEKVSHK